MKDLFLNAPTYVQRVRFRRSEPFSRCYAYRKIFIHQDRNVRVTYIRYRGRSIRPRARARPDIPDIDVTRGRRSPLGTRQRADKARARVRARARRSVCITSILYSANYAIRNAITIARTITAYDWWRGLINIDRINFHRSYPSVSGRVASRRAMSLS